MGQGRLEGIYSITWTTQYDVPSLKVLEKKGGRKVVDYWKMPFRSYCYLRKSEVDDKVRRTVESVDYTARFEETDDVAVDGHPLVKLTAAKPTYIGEIRKTLQQSGFSVYEGDIPYARRVLIQLDMKLDIPEERLFFDIEVDPTGGFPDPAEAAKRVISIAYWDQDDNFGSFSDDSEVKMIQDFLKFADKYFVLCGYNSARFDYPYLRNRCKILGIRVDWFRWVHVDLLPIYKRMTKRRKPTNYKLDTVAWEELGKTKLHDFEANLEVQKLMELFLTDRDTLQIYNVQDARLVKELDDKYGCVDIIFSIARETYSTVQALIMRRPDAEPGINQSVAVDGLILHIAKDRNPRVVFPSKQWVQDIAEFYKENEEADWGIVVIDPVPGLHENVVDFDFSSLYPSIIRTFNIGPDTYREDKSGDYLGYKGSFMAEPQSIWSEAVEFLKGERDKVNDVRKATDPDSELYHTLYARQYAFKEVLLSIYGVIGFPGSRYFNIDIATNVTQLGRNFLLAGKRLIESRGHQVLYGDTDSLFVKVSETDGNIVDYAKRLTKELNVELEEFGKVMFKTRKFFILIDIDRIYYTYFMTDARKKYAGIVIWQGEWTCYQYTVGFEVVRKDWPEAARNVQREALRLILMKKEPSELLKFKNETKRHLYDGEFDDGLVLHKGLNKMIDEYKANLPHVRAAKMLIEKGHEIRRGDKISYVMTGPKEVIPVVKETPSITAKGYSYIWGKSFEPIFDRLGILDYTQKRLGDFAPTLHAS